MESEANVQKLAAARRAEYLDSINQVLQDELSEPSEDFLTFIKSKVDTDGQSPLTPDEIDSLIRQAWKSYINDDPLRTGGLAVGDRVVVSRNAKEPAVRGKPGTLVDVRAIMVQLDQPVRKSDNKWEDKWEIAPSNLRKVDH